ALRRAIQSLSARLNWVAVYAGKAAEKLRVYGTIPFDTLDGNAPLHLLDLPCDARELRTLARRIATADAAVDRLYDATELSIYDLDTFDGRRLEEWPEPGPKNRSR